MNKWLRLLLIVLVLGVWLIGIGGKGCLWWRDKDDDDIITGSSGPAQTSISGLVFEQGAGNNIGSLGGAKVTVLWGEGTAQNIQAHSVSGNALRLLQATSYKNKKEGVTESDGSFSIPEIDANTTVKVVIEKDGYVSQGQVVNTGSDKSNVQGVLNRKNPNKKTIKSSQETDINTLTDTNEKGEAVPRCHIIAPAGAVAGDTEVELTPYFSMNALPTSLPAGYIGLAGADFSSATLTTFPSGKEAKPYIILPPNVRAEELSPPDIKLMEFIDGNWVIVKNPTTGLDKKCKYYSTGSYQGLLGPDDTVPEADQSKVSGTRPFCYVIRIPQVAMIKGTVRNSSGQGIAGAVVFGGGSTAMSDASGNYTLDRIIALSSDQTLIVISAIAPGYQLATAVTSVAAGETKLGVNLTLESLLEGIAIIGGNVKDGSNNNPIAGAKVICQTDPWITALTYDNKGTLSNLTDDTLSVSPPANLNVSSYQWSVSAPNGTTSYSTLYTNNSVVLHELFIELGLGSEGAFRVNLEVTLTSGKKVLVTAGFLLKIVGIQLQITDIRLPLAFESVRTLEAFTSTTGNYRLIGVPAGIDLKMQASKNGYQTLDWVNIAPLTKDQTKEQNFVLLPSGPGGYTHSGMMVNGGGKATSTNYQNEGSVCPVAVGSASSTNYRNETR